MPPHPDARRYADYDELVEDARRAVRISSLFQRSFAEAYSDAAVLAVEQFQEVRIAFLLAGTPEEPWDDFAELCITFLLESNVITSALRAVTRKLVTSPIKTAYLRRMLKRDSKAAALQKGPRTSAGTNGQPKLAERAIPKSVDDKTLRMYHELLKDVERLAEPFDLLGGTAKTLNERRKRAQEASRRQPFAPPSTAAAVLSAAHSYRRRTILSLGLAEVDLERFLRLKPAVEEIRFILDTMEPVTTDYEGVPFRLDQYSARCALVLEAAIWGREYSFSIKDFKNNPRGPGFPTLGNKNDTPFEEVDVRLYDYWIERFEINLHEYIENVRPPDRPGGISIGPPSFGRVRYAAVLRVYFTACARDFERLQEK